MHLYSAMEISATVTKSAPIHDLGAWFVVVVQQL